MCHLASDMVEVDFAMDGTAFIPTSCWILGLSTPFKPADNPIEKSKIHCALAQWIRHITQSLCSAVLGSPPRIIGDPVLWACIAIWSGSFTSRDNALTP